MCARPYAKLSISGTEKCDIACQIEVDFGRKCVI